MYVHIYVYVRIEVAFKIQFNRPEGITFVFLFQSINFLLFNRNGIILHISTKIDFSKQAHNSRINTFTSSVEMQRLRPSRPSGGQGRA